MKLARLADNEPFYSIVVERDTGAEIFDFSLAVPNTLRPDMPLSHLEYLPVLMRMQERPGVLSRALTRFQEAPDDEYLAFRRPYTLENHTETLLPPVAPPTFRHFTPAPLTSSRQKRPPQTPSEAEATPLFSFLNISSLVGARALVHKPQEGKELDFGLEIAAIIGKPGSDIPIPEADSYIAGYTICNNWCLRDVERRERAAGGGPGKSRDFATSLGPYLVTPDELADHVLPDASRGRVYNLTMTALINEKEVLRANARDMRWTFAEMIACASRNVTLQPGDLIASGAAGLNEREEQPIWLQSGDTVQLKIERLGLLENLIA